MNAEEPHAVVIALVATRNGSVRVMAGGRRVAELQPASVIALGLRAGAILTPEMAGKIERRAGFEKAYKAGVGLVSRAPKSARAVRERLARRGFDAETVVEVVSSMTAAGMIDDEALARRLVEEETARGGAGAPLLESKLAARGVGSRTTARVLEDALGNPAESAFRAARKRAESLGAGLAPEVKARRLYAFLARRGFDEHDATEAVRRVLGVAPDACD